MTSPRAILSILDSVKPDFLPSDLMAELRELLPDFVEVDTCNSWQDPEEFFKHVQPEILITGWGVPRLPERMAQMPSVRYVCHLGGTVRSLVPRSLLEEGLLVSNWGTCHAATVAECALFLILSTLRKATECQIRMHGEKKDWPTNLRPLSLYGRKVGLHGFGSVARCLVPLLRPFGVSISAYSSGVPSQVFRDAGIKECLSLDDLFSQSDVLVELEAASPINLGSVKEAHLRLLCPGAVFVNVGRAAVVEEAGLLKVASEGALQIGLDVYHAEPLPADNPLRGMNNVCLLNHQAGPTCDRQRDCGSHALANLRRYLSGQVPESVVSLDVFDRAT